MDEFEKCLTTTPDLYSINYFISRIELEIEQARSITEHGFIHSDDLTDPYAFPVVSDLVGLILRENKSEGEEELNKDTLSTLEILDDSAIKIKSDVFKQAYHLLCLNYWTLNRVLLNHLNSLNEKHLDIYTRVTHLNSLLTKLLPNSIKRHLHNKSICLTNNVYAGFDTEFKNIDRNLNKLLSVQVSVNGCFTLKVPTLKNKHVFGSLDVSTNKFYETKHNSKLINYHLIDGLIQEAIDFNISLNSEYKNYISKLTEALMSKGVKYYIKEDSYHFKFPSSDISSKFIEVKNKFTMKDLFNTIVELDELDSIKLTTYQKVLEALNVKPDCTEVQLSDFEYMPLKSETIYDTVFDSETNSDFSTVEKGETTQQMRIRKGLKLNQFVIYTNNMIYLTAHYKKYSSRSRFIIKIPSLSSTFKIL
jgi:hypothetical protein